MEDPERIRNLTVIQDFNNKKANAHAAIFVASMFLLCSQFCHLQQELHRRYLLTVQVRTSGLLGCPFLVIGLFGFSDFIQLEISLIIQQSLKEPKRK